MISIKSSCNYVDFAIPPTFACLVGLQSASSKKKIGEESIDIAKKYTWLSSKIRILDYLMGKRHYP